MEESDGEPREYRVTVTALGADGSFLSRSPDELVSWPGATFALTDGKALRTDWGDYSAVEDADWIDPADPESGPPVVFRMEDVIVLEGLLTDRVEFIGAGRLALEINKARKRADGRTSGNISSRRGTGAAEGSG